VPDLDPDLRALQEMRDCVDRAKRAMESIAHYGQEDIDRLCAAMAEAGARAAWDLARLAVEETGIGRAHYKILKNLFGSRVVWESIREEKTVGIVRRDEARRVWEVATPVGVIAAIVPTTNPTSTALGKALIGVKGKNAVVVSPHPRARRCIGETVEVLRRAIERAGGPPDLVCALSNPTIESTGALMKHRKVSLILATGGSGLVRAAYSSGKPAYGVGPGNVPVYVDRSADVASAARWLISSQSFDNATFCCSEQALVLDRPIADAMLAELRRRGAHLCSPEETEKLARYANRDGMMNPDLVGKDPVWVARQAGFEVPTATPLLLAHQAGVGKEHPLSIEILCPVLSVHLVDGWREGCELSLRVLRYGGLGHTLGVWARDEAVLEEWFLAKPANRIIVNGPTSEGAVGYSTNLVPSLSLGCGPLAGNITSDNITAKHLINLKRVAWPKRDWELDYERGLARAAELSGEDAPRGSGLAGDPALAIAAGGAARVAPQRSASPAWPGNAPSPARTEPEPAAAPARRTPSFTTGGTAGGGAPAPAGAPARSPAAATAPAAPAATAPAPRPAPPAPRRVAAGPYGGSALSPAEIENLLAHAGSGCPLGPCRGCPHHEVETGACTA